MLFAQSVKGSSRLQQQRSAGLGSTYITAGEINADFVIPSGELFQKLLDSGIERVHRDTFHASLGLGRYAIGLLWYSVLSGNDVKCNTFCDFDEEITNADVETVKECVALIQTMVF